MNPLNDIVCSILNTPFSLWTDCDKRDVLLTGRPTPILNLWAQKVEQKGARCYKKHFKSSWYSEYEWLCGSYYMEKLFCWPCLLLSVKQTVWNSAGFWDILNINRSLHKHSDSAEHLKCALQLKQLEKNLKIIVHAPKENNRLYVAQYNENVRLNRLIFKIIINAVLHLARQEVFRDYGESSSSSNRETFKELLSLLILTSPLEIQTQYSKIESVFTEDLETVHNEIIDCISEYINDYIKLEICSNAFFSVQIDDATDITQKSQCSVIVRLINTNGELVERFLGFFDASCDRTSEALFALVDSVLGPFDYRSKLVGQCYDGASVTSGHLNDLQKKVKDCAPQALFVHCLSHRLNLIIQSALKQISQCRIFFADIAGISLFFHRRAKRSYASDTNVWRRILSATDTQWSSHSKLLQVVEENWNDLIKVFREIADDFESDQTAVRLSNCFLGNMNDFEFAYLVIVFNEIFEVTSLLCNILQKESLDVVFCQKEIENSFRILQRKRSDEVFISFFEKAKQMGQFLGQKYAKLSQDELCQKYKLLYFEILDLILTHITIRFQDLGKLQFCTLADSSRFLQHSIAFPFGALTFIQETYPDLFKISRLKTELEIFYANEEYQHNAPLTQTLKLLQENKHIFQQVYKLFSLILTLPSTSASVETRFSALKRKSTYLRSSVIQERLTSLANIAIHKDLLNDLEKKQPFHDDITEKYAKRKNRRVNLIYKKQGDLDLSDSGAPSVDGNDASDGAGPAEANDEGSSFSREDFETCDFTDVKVKVEQTEDFSSEPETKRPRVEEYQQETKLDEALSLLKELKEGYSASQGPNDRFTIYGQHVASKLRSYPEKTSAIAEHAINNILFEADMGNYDGIHTALPSNDDSAQ